MFAILHLGAHVLNHDINIFEIVRKICFIDLMELTDDQWQMIEPMFPKKKPRRRW